METPVCALVDTGRCCTLTLKIPWIQGLWWSEKFLTQLKCTRWISSVNMWEGCNISPCFYTMRCWQDHLTPGPTPVSAFMRLKKKKIFLPLGWSPIPVSDCFLRHHHYLLSWAMHLVPHQKTSERSVNQTAIHTNQRNSGENSFPQGLEIFVQYFSSFIQRFLRSDQLQDPVNTKTWPLLTTEPTQAVFSSRAEYFNAVCSSCSGNWTLNHSRTYFVKTRQS